MQKLENALNDTYVTPGQPIPTPKAVTMPCPMLANSLCWMDLGRYLAEREGFYFRRFAIAVITKTQSHSSQCLR